MEKIKLSPEIKEKADELFALIEKEINEKNEDAVAEAMANEWGDYLKTSKGFDMLNYARLISLTESEQAVYGLEEAFAYMNDEAAGHISNISKNVLRMLSMWDFGKQFQTPEVVRKISAPLIMARDSAKYIDDEIDGLFDYRAKAYREEIEELKKAI